MSSETTIRLAQQSDMSSLIRLCALHADFEKASYTKQGKEEQLSEHLFSSNPSVHCLVVEKEEKLIGYATYMKQYATWDANYYLYMDCLFMEDGNRGQGIGEDLMTAIKQEARRLNCSHIQWQTPDFNVRAMKFYDRIGAKSKTKERYFLDV